MLIDSLLHYPTSLLKNCKKAMPSKAGSHNLPNLNAENSQPSDDLNSRQTNVQSMGVMQLGSEIPFVFRRYLNSTDFLGLNKFNWSM